MNDAINGWSDKVACLKHIDSSITDKATMIRNVSSDTEQQEKYEELTDQIETWALNRVNPSQKNRWFFKNYNNRLSSWI